MRTHIALVLVALALLAGCSGASKSDSYSSSDKPERSRPGGY